jgi:hypothetical protein
MVKPRLVIWTLAVVFLLAPTLWLGYYAFFTPPTYVSTSKMMVSGKLSISSAPQLQAPRDSTIDWDTVYLVVALLLIYSPGIALLSFALFYRGRSRTVAPPII